LLRNIGKIAFLDIHDTFGKTQVVAKEEVLSKEDFELISHLDTGDFIGVTGKIFRTKRGELSIEAKKITFLAKSFLPLPDKFHGITDPEIKYRKRHIDLMTNPDVKEKFIIKARIITIIREILEKKGFIEVETPLLQPLYGGANARPFVTESFVWKRKLYLSISPELYLKRLLVGGFEKVFTICKNFRNEGVDKSHNPEFTMLEAYEAYKDYNSAMDLIEEIYETIAIKLNGTTKIVYQDKEYDLKRPWKRLTMKDALKEYAKIDVDKMNDDELKKLLKDNKIVLEEYKRGLAIAELFGELVEEHLDGPVHIIDHPKETTPLCKLHRIDKELIERDEPYLNSMELGNIYSELNDPLLQEELMMDQQNQGRAKGENHPVDKEFIEALKYGMPPAYGVGFGVDRLVMLFTNSPNIRDIILFPLLKEEDEKQERK
jgi:lysyl-tRNA synthetase class 2